MADNILLLVIRPTKAQRPTQAHRRTGAQYTFGINTTRDLNCVNGILHKIDRVLLPM